MGTTKQRGKIILLFLGLLLLVALSLLHGQARNFFYSFSLPIQKGLYSWGENVSDFFQNIFRPRNIAEELGRLETENQSLLANVAKISELEKENVDLRAALGIGLNKDFKLSLAAIAGRPADGIILIDQGQEQGIEAGQAVITGQKTLCGKVKDVYRRSAIVELVFNKDISFDAVVLAAIDGSAGTPVLAKGAGSGALLLDLIPKDSAVKKDDIIFSAALSGIFPAGLLVGRIEEIKSADAQPFAQATARASCDVNNIERLFVAKRH